MTSIVEYIKDYLVLKNPVLDKFFINGIQKPSGEIIEFSDNNEKRFIGIGDDFGTAAYIRFDPKINHNTPDRRLSSSRSGTYNKRCRLVAYTFKSEFDSEDFCQKIVTDLKQTPFLGFKQRPQITIRQSNHAYQDIIVDELRKQPEQIGAGFRCIAIDFDLRYYADTCSDCEFNPDDQYVKIVNQDREIIKRLLPPSEYAVSQFDTINGGAPDTVYEITITPSLT